MTHAVPILSQKLRRISTARSPLPDTEIVGQTLARQLEKSLRPLVKTSCSATIVEARVIKVADAVHAIVSPALLAVVGIDTCKTHGLIAADAELSFHLIDMMLGGDPSVAPTGTVRSLTAIDMALGQLAQEAMLAALAETFTASFGRPLASPFTLLSWQQDIAQVRFAPLHGDVLVLTVGLDIGPAGRVGHLRVLLPLALLDVVCAVAQGAEKASAVDEPADLWSVQMRRAAAAAPVKIDAVLHSRRMTIVELMALRPGALIEIPATATQEVRLLITQRGGRRGQLAAGSLGTSGRSKAIRLAAPLDPSLREQIRRIL